MCGDILTLTLFFVGVCIPVIQGESVNANCDCAAHIRQKRLVNGRNTEIHSVPCMTAISLKQGNNYLFQCGGAIISSTYIITAGHCANKNDTLIKYLLFKPVVDVGDFDLSVYNETRNEIFKVSKMIRHEGYIDKTLKNDIALLKLSKPIKFTDNIRPACIPAQEMDLAGRNVTVYGWGVSRKGGYFNDILQYIEIPVLNNTYCQKLYDEDDVVIFSTVFCAGYIDGSKDGCQGDSGGPAILKMNDRLLQVGIVSYGIGCGTKGLAGVYTDISQYVDWIRDNTSDDPPCFLSLTS